MLGFVGVKMLITDRFPIPDWVSLVVVAGLIIGASLLSLILPAPPEAEHHPPGDGDEHSEAA